MLEIDNNRLINYLGHIPKNKICIKGLSKEIKRLIFKIKNNGEYAKLTNELKISDRLVQYWLQDKKAIPINQFKKIKSCAKETLDWSVYNNTFYCFSVKGGKTVFIPRLINGELCYLLGIIYGDGHISNLSFKRGKYGGYIKITDESLEHLLNIKNIFNSLFSISSSISKETRSKGYYLYTCSKVLHAFLCFLGVPPGNKSKILKFPLIIKNASSQLKLKFIGGLFDSDGSNTNSGIFLRMNSKQILKEVKQELLLQDILATGPYWDNKSTTWLIQIKRNNSKKIFKEKIGFKHPSKQHL